MISSISIKGREKKRLDGLIVIIKREKEKKKVLFIGREKGLLKEKKKKRLDKCIDLIIIIIRERWIIKSRDQKEKIFIGLGFE